MSTEVAAGFACTAQPPHRFALGERTRIRGGILVTLRRLDAPYPPRQVFVTDREMKMGYDDVYKACFVCVDRGRKETAIAVPKAEIEAGLPPA
ncbi:MAG TPA: hypothetical protein VMR54_14220 [Thermoanaerobaculia bacterium]|nr:hypothetical protein [Thermoanaerobaculia bacterium]